MRYLVKRLGMCSVLAVMATVAPATATIIDFEAQAASRGGSLTGIPDSPLTIGIATFTGGELLNGEIGLNADQTGVYASEGLFGSGETNPVVITFASPVNAFSVFVGNGDDVRSYTVSDNLGDSITQSLASTGALGAGTFSLPGNGLTTVYITSANANAWDLAIDNVSFTAPTSVPEPEPLFLVGGMLLLLATVRSLRLRTNGDFRRSLASSRN
jgi:hypothetical protein